MNEYFKSRVLAFRAMSSFCYN